MVQESELLSESHYSLLWGPRGWQNIYEVWKYFSEIIADADKE